MKVAIVHDWLNQVGGAESVLEVLKEVFPQAPIYTSIYWSKAMPVQYREWDIRTSWLNRLPLIKRHHQPFLPLYPLAFEAFDLRGYELVISNKSAFCHGVITPSDAVHICYCLTPTRFLWDYHNYVRHERINPLAAALLSPVLRNLRLWDKAAADRVEHFVAISETVRQRIKKFYRRDALVIHPPVDVRGFQVRESHDDYFLIVSRLIPYKRIDLAVQAFNLLGLPLKILGDGRDRRRLEAMANSNIEFLGRLQDQQVGEYLSRCRAFIFPGEEDFGIAPLEAQAAGRPVIAYAAGGALETVVDGVTGLFFREQRAESLAEVVSSFDGKAFDGVTIRQHAQDFDKEAFKNKLGAFVDEKLGR
ncbi:MAG: glycosyl transferase [Chloroflexi bacterium B3_Chlor]|nr:MAG: glycosyl transferase [Chloroflexi bacterium B3_Chlor]